MAGIGPHSLYIDIYCNYISNCNSFHLVSADMLNTIKIQNNAFIQCGCELDGLLQKISTQHIDNSMGLERLTSML